MFYKDIMRKVKIGVFGLGRGSSQFDSILLNNGEIVETGKHEELLAAGGFYSQLYNSQFEEEVC